MPALTTSVCVIAMIGRSPNGMTNTPEMIMKPTIKYVVTPWLTAVAIGGAIALAPIASAATVAAPATAPSAVGSAGTDPLVPYGTDPQVPYRLGYIDSNHDEANTTNGQLDVPF